eukprot:Rmarinus@m.29199
MGDEERERILPEEDLVAFDSDRPVREKWGSDSDLLITLVGYAVGIGNLWRFPYLVGKYGGGAFLIPFILANIFLATPLFYLELVLGQKFERSAFTVYEKLHSSWAGIGICCVVCVFIVTTYYNVLCAWCLVYFVRSFESPLPWADDPDTFFDEKVLEKTENIDDPGSMDLVATLVLALFSHYVLLFLCMLKGLHSSNYALYVTVAAPMVIVTVMFFKMITLDGAWDGLKYYLIPRMDALLDPELWSVATTQVLFSLSPAMGTAIAMGSYCTHKNDTYRAGVIPAAVNAFICFFGGLVVFSVIGYMANIKLGDEQAACAAGTSETNCCGVLDDDEVPRPVLIDIDDCVEHIAEDSGPGLAFITFAEALSEMPGSNVWSVLFFGMLYAMGLDSVFAWVETVDSFICDCMYQNYRVIMNKRVVRLVTCLSMFLLGFLYCTRSGEQWLDIVDHYSVSYVLLFVGTVELILIDKCYGFRRVMTDVYTMTGRSISDFWLISWKYIGPVCMSILLVIVFLEDLINGYEDFPWWADLVGWFSAALPISIALSYAFVSERRKSAGNTVGVEYYPSGEIG